MTTVKPLSDNLDAVLDDLKRYLVYHLGVDIEDKKFNYIYTALSYVVRDRVTAKWHKTSTKRKRQGVRRAYYLSMEFLIGRTLGNYLLNLDLTDTARAALNELATSLESIEQTEIDAGLGNGGLGRLAACFLDSCATLQLPVCGYGLHYKYGMFHQRIIDGKQVEEPDNWLMNGNPWEIERPELALKVHFGGRVEPPRDGTSYKSYWLDTQDVLAIPCDIPLPGYQVEIVNNLRLWKARATSEFDLGEFNAGNYVESVTDKNDAERISMVLYPKDATESGKELRLRQQYFLTSATLQDTMRIWENSNVAHDYRNYAKDNIYLLNDTHPSIAVAELMRLLLDIKGLDWDDAWQVTRSSIAYTNHTLLPEALESWPVSLLERVLPRHMQIIYEINARFIEKISAKWPGDFDRMRRMSIIDEDGDKRVRMAYLAIVGSFSVNGVAKLHSNLLKSGLFKDFYQLWPQKFNNKTNGITPRRWLMFANQEFSTLIDQTIGVSWRHDLSQLTKLENFADDVPFVEKVQRVKKNNKQRLSDLVRQKCKVSFDPNSMFDIQVKRIHEYKRQLLNVLHVIHLYLRIKNNDTAQWTNRCVLFAGKAAPGYKIAKDTIKLINNVANVINWDKDVGDKLRVAFLPDYGVSAMEIIAPGADLSEQISTAGKEASGTGNMKFMMNGAITIGTYDGANIEILDAVGQDNFFLFGLRAEEIIEKRKNYDPHAIINQNPALEAVIDLLKSNFFNSDEPFIFNDLIDNMLNPHDPWMTLADFASYVKAQETAAQAYRDSSKWYKMSINNTAKSGYFSADRTIGEYNKDIWKL